MTNFVDAFNQGQAAAEHAAQSRNEIDEVFDAVAQSLSEATNGRIELARVQFDRPQARTMADFIGGVASFLTRPPAEQETWLAARNPKATDTSWRKLAKWTSPREGYPCSLSYEKRELNCHDKDALESEVAGLLASAWAGERLRELLHRPLKTDELDEKN